MFNSIRKTVKSWERKARHSFGTDISTPAQRFMAHVHFHIFDVAYLRVLWTNFYKVTDGVFRSNQPTAGRLARYKRRGITNILNLRGEEKLSHFLFEQEACTALGLTLYSIKFGARHAPSRQSLIDLFDLFDRIDKPFLLHCKSGADRAGFVSALYLLDKCDASVPEALAQMGLRYAHLDFTDTGVLDYTLNIFGARQSQGIVSLREWVRDEYNAQIVHSGFENRASYNDIVTALIDAKARAV